MRFGYNSLVSAAGKGKVQVISIHTINYVFYVPALKMNLLSVGQLQEKGYELNNKVGFCKIRDSHLGDNRSYKHVIKSLYIFTTPQNLVSLQKLKKNPGSGIFTMGI